jgi:hypothetical protein
MPEHRLISPISKNSSPDAHIPDAFFDTQSLAN